MSRISMVVALGHGNVIGKDNGLLWHLPDDLKHFKDVTAGHPVVMGRRTWDSLPEKVRPLPGRTNIVVTRDANYQAPGAQLAHSWPEALELAKHAEGSDEICVIGGGELFKIALPDTDRLYLTLVDDPTPGTVYFPDYAEFTKVIAEEAHEENGYRYVWKTVER
jgi:dihydrofolate reductase